MHHVNQQWTLLKNINYTLTPSTQMTAYTTLPLADVEALCSFLADRAELWRTHAAACGVEAPDDTVRLLARAHAEAVRNNSNNPV
jgi:hypothetical protein